MQLAEGKLLKRTQIIFQEATGVTWRTLLNLCGWLGTYDADVLNRIVLYLSVWGDASSSWTVGDQLEVQVKSYGKYETFTFLNTGNTTRSGFDQQKEFTLVTIGNPSTATDVLLLARASAWLITETHRFIIELQAYLLDVTPEQPIERSF